VGARRILVTLLWFAAFAIALAACRAGDGGSGSASVDVTIVALESPTARSSDGITSKGGLPARTVTPAAAPSNTPEPVAPTEPPATTHLTEVAPATSTPEPPTAAAPTTGRWIAVDVTNFTVRLMDGESAVREISPVGVGVAIDTGAYISTQTGLFHVHSKREELVYDAPFDTYISHWVGFDADKDNGFHSFLKDAAGNVVDASTGRVSNGCIRTGEPDAVYAYAEIGMPVWVHW
jgi:hypothetical protein